MYAVTDQGAAVVICQRHPSAQLAAQDLVLLAEEIILFDQILAEELLNLGDEGSGGAA